MSFTSQLKNEIVGIESSRLEAISELSAIFSVVGFFETNLKITTESVALAKRVFSLTKKVFQINCKITVRKGLRFRNRYIYILEIEEKDDFVLKTLGLSVEKKQQLPLFFVIDDDEMKKVFLRGIFLAVGSLSDPKKTSYHLEFVVDDVNYAIFILDLLNNFSLNAKILEREKKMMIYIKESEKISDFLKIIGTGGGLFYFEDVRIYRDHKNMTNRLNNCEQANVDKTIFSSDKQIRDINLIINEGLYDALSNKLMVVADYRLKYPDASLTELAEIISLETEQKITKSGLYHRFIKIAKFAKKIVKS